MGYGVRTSIALLAVMLLGAYATACGEGSGSSQRPASAGTSAAAMRGQAKGDQDNDDAQPVDNDQQSVRTYGHEASQGQRLAVAALVKRYFADAAANDGAAACTLLNPGIARSAPLSYGKLGPSYLRGAKTCAAVMRRLFEHYRPELSRKGHPLKVPSLRVEGTEGFAMLRFSDMPERQIAVGRQDGSWYVEMLLDEAMRRAP